MRISNLYKVQSYPTWFSCVYSVEIDFERGPGFSLKIEAGKLVLSWDLTEKGRRRRWRQDIPVAEQHDFKLNASLHQVDTSELSRLYTGLRHSQLAWFSTGPNRKSWTIKKAWRGNSVLNSRQWRLSPKKKGTGRRSESSWSKWKGKVVQPSEQVQVVREGVSIREVFWESFLHCLQLFCKVAEYRWAGPGLKVLFDSLL